MSATDLCYNWCMHTGTSSDTMYRRNAIPQDWGYCCQHNYYLFTININQKRKSQIRYLRLLMRCAQCFNVVSRCHTLISPLVKITKLSHLLHTETFLCPPKTLCHHPNHTSCLWSTVEVASWLELVALLLEQSHYKFYLSVQQSQVKWTLFSKTL